MPLRRVGASKSGVSALERGWGHVLKPKAEDTAMGAQSVEDPREVSLCRDAQGSAGRYDAEQDARSMSALGASGE